MGDSEILEEILSVLNSDVSPTRVIATRTNVYSLVVKLIEEHNELVDKLEQIRWNIHG